jgi:translation initiation factor IF-2
MDAQRHSAGDPGDDGIELPLVVWADEEAAAPEPEPAASASAIGKPAAAAESDDVAEATDAASAAPDGQAGALLAALEAAAPAAATVRNVLSVGSVGEGAHAPSPAADSTASTDSTSLESAGSFAPEESVTSGYAHSAGAEPAADPAARRRLSRPMTAAAALSGLALVGLSAILAQTGGGSSAADPRPAAALYPPATPGSGFTPGGGAPTQGAPGGAPVPGATGTPAAAGHPAGHGASPGAVQGSVAPGGTNTSGLGGAPNSTTGSTGSTGYPAHNPSSPAPAPSTPPPATYDAVAGPGCTDSGTAVNAYGWYDDGNSGFLAHDHGGLDADGCPGGYWALPMSGSADVDDSANYVIWTFHTGAVTHGTCAIAVFVPDVSNIIDVGGDPAYYTVQGSSSAYTDTVGSFDVDQVAHLGDWVPVGDFPVSGGLIAVMMHSRGIDWTDSADTYAHDVADAIEVSCTA